MPDSWANAFAPTIALFGCTGKPVMPDTMLRRRDDLRGVDARRRRRSTSVGSAPPSRSPRAPQLPARSPRPLMVHSTWRAPSIITPASELATAMPEVVVAMHRPHGAVGIGNPLAQRRDEGAELPGHRIADGVGNVDRGRARGDRRLDQPAQEVELGAASVLGRELDVVAHSRAKPTALPPARAPAPASSAASSPCGAARSR